MIQKPSWMFDCQLIEGFGPRVSVACTGGAASDLRGIAFVRQIPTFPTQQICSAILCRRLCLFYFCAGIGFGAPPMKVYKKDEPLDENGFQQVLKGGERAAMEAFIRHIDGKGEELHLFVLKKGVGMPARKSEIVWKTLSKDHV